MYTLKATRVLVDGGRIDMPICARGYADARHADTRQAHTELRRMHTPTRMTHTLRADTETEGDLDIATVS